MEQILEWVKSLHTDEGLQKLVLSGGMITLVIIVFAETGLLVGFFLPGDSLLITAGILTAKGLMGDPLSNVITLNLVLAVAAVVGDQVGFVLGRKTGHAIFSRPDSRLFKKKHAIAAHEFYLKQGAKAIVLARFVPIMRTFVPFIAGVAEMPYRNFVFWNIFGGILWVTSMLWIGYALGQTKYAEKLHQIIIIVIFVSFLPLIYEAAKAYWQNRKAKTGS
jgi:membrane-associated protein